MKLNDFFGELLSLDADKYNELSEKIQYILETKPLLTSKDIYLLVEKIYSYYFYKRRHKEKVDNSYFEKVLDTYDTCISEKDRFDILLMINNIESFYKYAKKHYNFFKIKFQETLFVDPSSIDELDTLEDVEEDFNYHFKDNKYKLKLAFFDENIISSIYQLFREDINFLVGNKIVKYYYKYLPYMNFKDLIETFINALKQGATQNEVEIFWVVLNKSKYKNEWDSQYIYNLINNREILEKLIKSLKKHYILKSLNNTVSSGFNELFRTKVKEYDICGDTPKDLFSLSYINSLNKLETLSSYERKNSPLYLKCFQIFLKEFLSNYKDEITKEEINILEALFQRIINHKNIFEILAINNKKSLYHYYKTGKFNLNINIHFELIKNYNAKQYLDLNSLYNKKQSQKTNVVDCNNDNLTIIVSLNMLGYDLTKKIINKDYAQLYYVTNFLSKKTTDYIIKIKPLLLDIINTIGTQEEYTIDAFLTCFTLLYEQSNIKITYTRIKNMVDSISYALLPNNYNIANNLEKLNFVHKGVPLKEKVEGIKLYDSYRFRLYSSIPDIKGKINNCEYQMVDMHSEEIISNGIEKYIVKDKLISSCLTPAGKASSCLRHGAINPHGRFFKVTYQDKIVAYSWVWRCGEVLCFDNIEITENSYKLDNPEYIIYTAYKSTADAIRKVTNEIEGSGIKLVIIGRNDIDVSNSFIDKLERVNDYTENLFKPNSKDNLYLEDSSKKQLILSGKYNDGLKTYDIEPIYKYRRKEIKRFSDFDKEYLRKELNSIYFDYCLENNNKYEKITTNYIDGYLNEDWFLGYKENNTYDFYYRGNDERLFKEAKTYLKKEYLKTISVPSIIKSSKEDIDILLNRKNYQFNIEKILTYLQDTKKQQFALKEKYYTHSPKSLETFSKILKDNAITSAEYGKHEGGTGCNGKNFISVARVNSDVYNTYAGSKTFILTDNICAFSQTEFNQLDLVTQFKDSKYPFRSPTYSGELHVLDKINLDKAIGIFVSQTRIDELVQIVYLQELFQNEIPLILFKDNTYVDKDIIKKYSKVLK